jgi:hypothetical protein
MAIMRASRIVVALGAVVAVGPVVAAVVFAGLAACGPSQPPVAPAPKGPTACARASDSMVQTMLDRLSSDGPPPTEAADALRNLIRERCEQDNWSAEATKCLIAMKTVKDAEPCAQLMTEEQQAALVRDEAALFGPTDKTTAAPAGSPAANEPPAGEPPAAKSEKPNE